MNDGYEQLLVIWHVENSYTRSSRSHYSMHVNDGCKACLGNSETMLAPSSLSRGISTMSQNRIADYDDKVSSPILFGGKCIRSASGSTDKPTELFTDSAVLIPKRLAEYIDAMFFVPFASLGRDVQRLRPARLPVVRLEPQDSKEQRPPQSITRHSAIFPLSIKDGIVPTRACFQCIAGHMLGADNCFEFLPYRMSPWGEDLPVMIWFHGSRAVFNDAWGALGLHDGASLARASLFMLVVAQCRLGILRFLILERGAETTKDRQMDHIGFEDQHFLMRWLQNNAAGLDLSKESAILVGHDVGG